MSMKQYELLVVSDGGLTEEENKQVLDRHKEVIVKAGGKVLDEASWGRRRIAYPINKKGHGIYQFLYLEANGEVLDAALLQMGYDELVLKSFVTTVDDYQESKKAFEALLADPQKNAKLTTDILGA